MVEKKLLTVAGALAILACGACFLPPLPRKEPPPPTIRGALTGIRSIRVEVENRSQLQHLDSVNLARRIADAINEQSWKTKVSAHVEKATSEDSVLTVSVLNEIVQSTPSMGAKDKTFTINDSATLKRPNGALIWQETEIVNPITRNIGDEKVPDIWKSPGILDGVTKSLSDRLVFRVLFWH